MANVDIRQRAGYLFLAIVLGQVILISAQVNSRRGVPVLESVTLGVFSQVQRAAAAVVNGGQRVWSGYLGLRRVSADNAALRQQLAEAQIALQQQRALADRSRSLERLLDLRDRLELSTVAADIIGAGAIPEFRTVTLDKGTTDGLRRDMAVLAPAGIVGRVVIAAGHASKVQLLIDRNAAAGAIVERSRAQGVAIGDTDDRLRLDYVSETADVVVGDMVMTSGIDGIYPKGFVIGRVDVVEKSGGAYRRIVVKPAVDFTSLEEVLVVTTPAPDREAATGGPE